MTSNDTLLADLTATLTAEGWTPVEPNTQPTGVTATAFTHPKHRLHLLITTGPNEPTCADLVGPLEDNASDIWSVAITKPTAEQILEAARAATAPDSCGPFHLQADIAEASWSATAHRHLGQNPVSSSSHPDGDRTVFCYALVVSKRLNEPGGWIFRGGALNADATYDTPQAVILALALSGTGRAA